MVRAVFASEAGGVPRLQRDGIPGNAAVRLPVVATPVIKISNHAGLAPETNGFDAVRVRIPFGDEALSEGDVHRDSGCMVGIEIEDWGFHPHRATEAALEIRRLEMLDECREIS